MTAVSELAEGARNLLLNCAGLKAGDEILILHEDPALAWYDLDAPLAVLAEARKLGMSAVLLQVGAPDNDRDPRVAETVAAKACSIFFARIGDQDRFANAEPGKASVMCYARDAAMLASTYGRTDHRAFLELKTAVDNILLGADRIEISCPRGTDISGGLSERDRESREDVSIRRFPLGVSQPLAASGFSGRVALAGYLTPTGSKIYEPPFLELETPIFAEVVSGRIVEFTGAPDMTARVREHYKMVAEMFRIDPDAVHSWHAGIHPGCAYTADVAQNPDRWANTVFTNPRFLHFHTCGSYPPGEICWMVQDPTIAIDGTILWERGRLRPEAFVQARRCLDAWPELKPLFANPSELTGLPD
ncbi:MAG: hypothetical protein O7I42_18095 [Alphaproteobacteria bacterium]|nr:hypothetical protein [Alphaproteobacteria bacterium]